MGVGGRFKGVYDGLSDWVLLFKGSLFPRIDWLE